MEREKCSERTDGEQQHSIKVSTQGDLWQDKVRFMFVQSCAVKEYLAESCVALSEATSGSSPSRSAGWSGI